VKYWEIIADNLKKAGFSVGWVSGVDLISDALPFGTTDNVSGRYRSVNRFDTAKPTHAGVS
jgi:hypothetical protein